MSRFHFLRLFKEITGLSPHAYLIQRRVKRAKEAIEDGKSLIDAAVISGFADQSHMGRRFKAMFSVSPGQYKNSLSGRIKQRLTAYGVWKTDKTSNP